MTKLTNGLRGTTIALSALAAMATAAEAQQVGTYNGTTADGNSISVTVGIDSNNGAYEITGFGLGLSAYCPRTATTFNTGWGFGGLAQDIVAGVNEFTLGANQVGYIYVDSDMAFHGTTSVTGHVSSRTAAFLAGNPPTQAEFCTSKSQAFTANFAAPVQHTPPPGVAYVYHGRIQTSARPAPYQQ